MLPLGKGLANYGLHCQIQPTIRFINKVLLGHSHIHSFAYFLWLLSCYNGKLNSETDSSWLAKPKIFTDWPFAGKVAEPALDYVLGYTIQNCQHLVVLTYIFIWFILKSKV